ncbi:MAG: glycoside hydrolase family 27 protein [Verrucomicrobiota bacterium]
MTHKHTSSPHWLGRLGSQLLLGCALLTFQGLNTTAADTKPEPYRGLAATPPMGWNSWNTFGKEINEDVVKGVADTFVKLGLKDLGYQYVVIDDHWHGGRDSQGKLLANPKKFPGGIKALAAYIHDKGLKFGIYSCAGDKTCGGEVGSYGHEEDDATTFASWDVDYLKYDYCYAPDDFPEAIKRYTRMGDALKATGRPIIFSICEWGPRSPWLWGRKAGGHLWRISFDVGDLWDTPHNAYSCIGILAAIDASANLEKHAGPGGWNDPDMLVVGLGNKGYIKGGGCNSAEYQTQVSMWCLLAAPLMIGCDIRNMDAETRRILTNPEAIAVDQDPLGRQGNRVTRTASTDVWRKPLVSGGVAIALLNRGEQPASITAQWKDLGLKPGAAMALRDLWAHQDLGTFKDSFTTQVGPHATVLVRATPEKTSGK